MRWRSLFAIGQVLGVSVLSATRVVLASLFRDNSEAYAIQVAHRWARSVLQILKVQYQIFNLTNFKFLEGRAYIIMSNHSSHVDIPLIYEAFTQDKISMVSKKELFAIPVFGKAMRVAGCLSLDRGNMRQAVQDLAMAKERMLAGSRLWIAPEGTRAVRPQLGKFKSGGFKAALAAQAIIVPVTIVGSHRVLPTKTLEVSLHESVAVYIGTPIDTTAYSEPELLQLMEDTKQEIASRLPVNIAGGDTMSIGEP